MRDIEHKNKLPFNLQLFAEGGAEPAPNSTEPAANNNAGDQNQTEGANNTGAKTFTQDEVNAIGAKEKNQGKNSILKLFGCADENAAKTEAEEFKKWKETQLTEEQKRAQEQKKLTDSAAASEQRAIIAESKVTLLSAGVTAESLEDVLAIAMGKVTEEKTLDKVIAEMKKEQKYSGFFGESSSNGGTGSSASHNKGGQNNSAGNIGERLAKAKLANTAPKSKFFQN